MSGAIDPVPVASVTYSPRWITVIITCPRHEGIHPVIGFQRDGTRWCEVRSHSDAWRKDALKELGRRGLLGPDGEVWDGSQPVDLRTMRGVQLEGWIHPGEDTPRDEQPWVEPGPPPTGRWARGTFTPEDMPVPGRGDHNPATNPAAARWQQERQARAGEQVKPIRTRRLVFPIRCTSPAHRGGGEVRAENLVPVLEVVAKTATIQAPRLTFTVEQFWTVAQHVWRH